MEGLEDLAVEKIKKSNKQQQLKFYVGLLNAVFLCDITRFTSRSYEQLRFRRY